MWKAALGHQDVGAHDGFFDAGGDSVAAVVVAEQIAQRYGIAFGQAQLFKFPTVSALAAHVASAMPGGAAQDDAAAWPAQPAATNAQAAPREVAMRQVPADDVAIIGNACRIPGAEDHRPGRADAQR